ncbi:hypothetical protein [Streptomyces kanamyceticus]|uniref:Uncharacterized protein n=1 Tax=Streptomyces kanamyceticus TaxID=1967 RepID=A0A5J6GPR1_STRKN|nr:hypothetical protein [Streptomyces kanamyceticus]QEU96973.1 hypothetical protein CP970_44045 [Streptomyces kanamyceticus]
MNTQAFKGAYLEPLFHQVEQLRTDGAYRQLPAPAPSSSLATDDAPLGPYAAAHLIRASYTAGLAHADALRRLTLAGEIDPTSPFTLLRSALENFATGIWLLSGNRPERQRRALSLWDEDMRNRHQHEQDTGQIPAPPGQSGALRRAEIRALADQLALAPLAAPKTNEIISQAAPAAGLTAVKVCAAWRAASGFAHGRYWPNLRASQPRAALPADDHGVYTVALVIDEDQHQPLAHYCHTMLNRLQDAYHARATAR